MRSAVSTTPDHISTKYTANYKHKKPSDHPISVNRAGNSYKSMYVSVEESLKKLQVSYIDVLCKLSPGAGSRADI